MTFEEYTRKYRTTVRPSDGEYLPPTAYKYTRMFLPGYQAHRVRKVTEIKDIKTTAGILLIDPSRTEYAVVDSANLGSPNSVNSSGSAVVWGDKFPRIKVLEKFGGEAWKEADRMARPWYYERGYDKMSAEEFRQNFTEKDFIEIHDQYEGGLSIEQFKHNTNMERRAAYAEGATEHLLGGTMAILGFVAFVALGSKIMGVF